MPILRHGLDACPVSCRQQIMLLYRMLEKLLTLTVPKWLRCIKMFGISYIAETVAMRRDRFMSNSGEVCEICCAMSGHL